MLPYVLDLSQILSRGTSVWKCLLLLAQNTWNLSPIVCIKFLCRFEGNGSFSPPGLVSGSYGPAVQDDWLREWKAAEWEETQSYQSECLQLRAGGWQESWIHVCLFFNCIFPPVRPSPPSAVISNVSLLHANPPSVWGGPLSGSLEMRWTRFDLQPVFFPFLALKNQNLLLLLLPLHWFPAFHARCKCCHRCRLLYRNQARLQAAEPLFFTLAS